MFRLIRIFGKEKSLTTSYFVPPPPSDLFSVLVLNEVGVAVRYDINYRKSCTFHDDENRNMGILCCRTVMFRNVKPLMDFILFCWYVPSIQTSMTSLEAWCHHNQTRKKADYDLRQIDTKARKSKV